MQKSSVFYISIFFRHTNVGDNMEKLSFSLKSSVNYLKEIFKKDGILRIREISTKDFECAVLFMDGMVNNQILNESIVRPLLTYKATLSGDIPDFIIKKVLFAGECSKTDNVDDMLSSLLYGDTLIIFDGTKEALTVNTKGWRTRGVSEPGDERVLQGPREGFDEAVMLNMALIRRKLPTPDLCVEYLKLGRRTDTRIFVCYLKSVVNRKALLLLKERLKKIDIDGVLDVNYINEIINPNRFSPFKTAGTTEKPDIVAARLLEGRVALLVDGTPVVLTVPYLFSENFQSDDDYYLNFTVAAIGRILRFICFFLSISVPALYIALITHHKALIPSDFFISVINSRNGVPFPSVVEALMLILIFEILRETGIRMQQSVGHALSIVGGLVVGQASVEAKIVSAPILIIVALSGIAGLMLPRLKGIIFYAKVSLVILSNFFGLMGYFSGITVMLILILSLDSFGTDYTASLNNISFQSLKDTLVRFPWNRMKTRPYTLSQNKIRQEIKNED